MTIRDDLFRKGWFADPGAYVLVDGQFGSTGKGLLAGYLATVKPERITCVTTNAGPNSGHTAYLSGGAIIGEPQVITRQVPVASVFLAALGYNGAKTFLNAGAVIDDAVLAQEVKDYLDYANVFIHPNACVIQDVDRVQDELITKSIAGTGKGVGPAIARKVLRDGHSLARHVYMPQLPSYLPPGQGWDNFWDWSKDVVFVETAQGFSLGINSQFYPHVTSRECTVMQAIADARIPAQKVNKVACTFRTYPIRVGSVNDPKTPSSPGYSGKCYDDQHEESWERLQITPELTTVTKRVRRVFSWSRQQFRDAVAANRPDLLFINFCNYVSNAKLMELLYWVIEDYHSIMGDQEPEILLGYGPRNSDIKYWTGF